MSEQVEAIADAPLQLTDNVENQSRFEPVQAEQLNRAAKLYDTLKLESEKNRNTMAWYVLSQLRDTNWGPPGYQVSQETIIAAVLNERQDPIGDDGKPGNINVTIKDDGNSEYTVFTATVQLGNRKTFVSEVTISDTEIGLTGYQHPESAYAKEGGIPVKTSLSSHDDIITYSNTREKLSETLQGEVGGKIRKVFSSKETDIIDVELKKT